MSDREDLEDMTIREAWGEIPPYRPLDPNVVDSAKWEASHGWRKIVDVELPDIDSEAWDVLRERAAKEEATYKFYREGWEAILGARMYDGESG